MTNPRYDHDCSSCTFLGQHGSADLYFCPQGGAMPKVIARYSSTGADYTSGLFVGNRHPDLSEARMRATARGLLGRPHPVDFAAEQKRIKAEYASRTLLGRIKGFATRAMQFVATFIS